MHRFFLYGAILVGVLFGLLLLFLYGSNPFDQKKEISSVVIGGEIVHVEVADTPEERAQGLSGRPDLAQGEGMLFIFERDGIYPFWMKDMLFSIDIAWMSLEGVVIDIAHSVSPDTYPASFGPDVVSRYVLELPAGFMKEHKIQTGDTVLFR